LGLFLTSLRNILTDWFLQAEVAFIDEVFKANSAILNTLLTILNERLFDNGTQRLPVPLVCLVAASNELPESEELDALYDRFLIRCHVSQVRTRVLKDPFIANYLYQIFELSGLIC
jgi:MoxR-like ATPase